MSKRFIIVVLCLFSSLALTLFTGCGQDDENLLFKVGDRKVTVEDFKTFVRYVPRTFISAQDEFDNLRGYLDSMINSQVLINLGYDRGLDQSTQMNELVEANRTRFLLDALYNKHVGENLNVSETEIRQWHADLAYQIRAFHILLRTEDSANIMLERLKAGEDFEQLTFDYSIDPTAKRNRGDLGFFTRGAMVDEFESVAFKMEPGEISPVVKSNFGFHIIKLIEKRPNEAHASYDEMHLQIERDLMGRLQRKLTEDFLLMLDNKYPITLDTSVADYVIYKRKNLYPPQILDRLPKNDFDDRQLDRNERELVLATWDGGKMTLMDYLGKARQSFPEDVRPNFDDYDSLQAAIKLLARNEILGLEAIAEGIDKQEYFISKMKLFREYGMADLLKNDSTPISELPSEDAVRKYYDKHLAEFITERRVYIFEIALGDELLARKLAGELKTLSAFQAAASRLSERPEIRVKRGEFGFVEEALYPYLFRVAWKTPLNVIGGPVLSRGKYSIFWPVKKEDKAYKDFLSVKNQINTTLTKEVLGISYQEWLKELRGNTSIKVYDDKLWTIIDTERYNNLPSADTIVSDL